MNGSPHMNTQLDSGGPMGLWNPSKATSDFRGDWLPVGGSQPEEGKSPFDDYRGPSGNGPLSASDFFGEPMGTGNGTT